MADSAQRKTPDGDKGRAKLAQGRRESRRYQQRLFHGPAHGGDPANLVDCRPDHGEVEALATPDIAEEDLADMQTKVHFRRGKALGSAALIQLYDAFACRCSSRDG